MFGFIRINFKSSGSVQVLRLEILKVRVRFRFNDRKIKRFRFGSGSPKKSGFYRFAVQVRVRFDSLLKIMTSQAEYLRALQPFCSKNAFCAEMLSCPAIAVENNVFMTSLHDSSFSAH